MSTEGSTKLVVVVEEELPSFIRKSSELTKLLKGLTKASVKALEILETGMESKDEKIATSCAEKIISYLLATSKEHSSDQMQRLIAEIRFKGQGRTRQLDATGAQDVPNRPVVDFSTIRSIE